MPPFVQSYPCVLVLLVFAPAPVPRPVTVYLGTEVAETKSGLTISGVFVFSPAGEAGLLPMDEILTFDRVPVRNVADLTRFLKKKKPDESITIVVRREGKEHSFPLKLIERQRFSYLGAVLGDLQISEICPNSPASKAGLQVQDTLVSIDGTKLESLRELLRVLKERNPGQVLNVLVRRGDKDVKAQVKLGERPGY